MFNGLIPDVLVSLLDFAKYITIVQIIDTCLYKETNAVMVCTKNGLIINSLSFLKQNYFKVLPLINISIESWNSKT